MRMHLIRAVQSPRLSWPCYGTAAQGKWQRSRRTRARRITAVGVLVNELARPVPFLNLPDRATGGAPGGNPAYLSLHASMHAPPQWDVADASSMSAKTRLVAIAADAPWPHCAPLGCTDGMPAAAQRTLLYQLATGGRLQYHGDIDWPSIAIANAVMMVGASPWRCNARKYHAALHAISAATRPLSVPAVSRWDSALSAAMRDDGHAIVDDDDDDAVSSLLPI